MKNCISKGLCFFFITISLFVAQSGHGGSTEVIARIEPESTAPTQETQPYPIQPEPSDTRPIQTGEIVTWLAFVLLTVSGMIILLFWIKELIH